MYGKSLGSMGNRGSVPQNVRLEPNQVLNNAGGYTFKVDKWDALDRFLILGSDKGTYYVAPRTHTMNNLQMVKALVESDGMEVVNRVRAIVAENRAPRMTPAIVTLAVAGKYGATAVKHAVAEALPAALRTAYQLFEFIHYAKMTGAYKQRIIISGLRAWYESRSASELTYQMLKYQARTVEEGNAHSRFTHLDALRLAHPTAVSDAHRTLYLYAKNGWDWVGDDPHPDPQLVRLWAAKRLAQEPDNKALAIRFITDYDLPREAIPDALMKQPEVWEALLERMPMNAMLRTLNRMTAVGLIAPLSDAARTVAARLNDAPRIIRARVHPVAVLNALLTYSQGKGLKGSLTWTPVTSVTDALDAAFYKAFGAVTPTNKNIVLGIDVSGSMEGGAVSGLPAVSPRAAAAAMAMVTAAVEPSYAVMGFAGTFIPLDITPRKRLDDVMQVVDRSDFGSTDCALPMLWAMGYNRTGSRYSHSSEYVKERGSLIPVDAFVVYTDSETWAGGKHPHVALEEYRQASGRDAKLIVVGMTATDFTVANPNDAGMMDVVGFDAAAPAVISRFIAPESVTEIPVSE